MPFSHPHYLPIQAAKRKLLEERADLRAQTQYMVPTYEELTERYPCPLPTLALASSLATTNHATRLVHEWRLVAMITS